MLTSLFNLFPVARYHQFLTLAAFTRNDFSATRWAVFKNGRKLLNFNLI
jgi:hypothetical protein